LKFFPLTVRLAKAVMEATLGLVATTLDNLRLMSVDGLLSKWMERGDMMRGCERSEREEILSFL
jgi:hypothetical protein